MLTQVESLLDHLFFHPNTAPFISYRLMQRFGTSNPTPAYVQDVATAFRTGTYNGRTYSGDTWLHVRLDSQGECCHFLTLCNEIKPLGVRGF